MDISKLKSELNRPLILDGAIGSLLLNKGVKADKYLWSSIANITNQALVTQIHMLYIRAGADIITTNTFRTNPSMYKMINYDIPYLELVSSSVKLALSARKEKKIIIAGSNAPAEDCYQVERTINEHDLEYNHKKHIELLFESGCDLILNETQSHWDEIKIITKYCSENYIPYIISFFFDNNLNLLSGEPLSEAVEFVSTFSPIAIGFNCIQPNIFRKLIDSFHPKMSWGFYLNCGSGNYTDEIITCGVNPKEYLEEVKHYLPSDPYFVGACCGSSHEHIKQLKEYFDDIY